MARVNIIEKLKKEEQSNLPKVDMLQDVKLLLDGQASKEKEILVNLGLDEHIKAAEEQQRAFLAHKQISEQFGEFEFFHIDTVLDIAEKYRLFLKPASSYAGKIPGDLGAILARLNEQHKLGLDQNASHIREKIVIMAPPPMFKEHKNPVQRVKHLIRSEKDYSQREKAKREAERLARLRALAAADPVMFLVQGEYLITLKKWGNDFTPFRRTLGRITKTNFLSYSAVILFTMAFIAVMIGSVNFLMFKDIIPTASGLVNSIPDSVKYTDGTTGVEWNAGFLGILSWIFCITIVGFGISFLSKYIKYFIDEDEGGKELREFKTRTHTHFNGVSRFLN